MQIANPLTPLQLLASKYRTSDHQAQKTLRNLIKKLLIIKNTKNESSQQLSEYLHNGREELLNLKRKLSATCLQQSNLYDICRKRIHRHQQFSKQTNFKQQAWKKDERYKFEFKAEIMQYLYSRGQIQRAKQLQRAFQQQDMFGVQTQLFEQAAFIIGQISNNYLQSIRRWIFQNLHNLDKNESSIQFDLMCCDYINLILKGNQSSACSLIRNTVKKMKLTLNQKKIVQKLSGYLICIQIIKPDIQEYLYILKNSFKKNFTQIYCITFESNLQRQLTIGLSALKTVCCCKYDLRNNQLCPICAERVAVLAERIPMLTKQESILKCRINDSIMNEVNYPMVLPNGQIYSISGLDQTESNGQYICKITQTRYKKDQAKKVFLA